MKHTLTALLLLSFLVISTTSADAQRKYPSGSSCPVLSTLASSDFHGEGGKESIVIWFANRNAKSVVGVEFHLLFLDTGGNKYPASTSYQVSADAKSGSGDVVAFDIKDEREHFGDRWDAFVGIEVQVVSVLFDDASTWKPTRGAVCSTSFLNANYAKDVAKIDAAVQKQMNREHSSDTRPATKQN
jgi:hypothetical protein